MLSPKEEYPLHVQVTQSDTQFVSTVEFETITLCYPLFGLRVCNTSGSAAPGQHGYATMMVQIEETGESATVYCATAQWVTCTALPVGRYAARFWDDRHFLAIPVLPPRGTKEVAARFMKVPGSTGKRGGKTDWFGVMPRKFEGTKK